MQNEQKATSDNITVDIVLRPLHIRRFIKALFLITLFFMLGTWMVGNFWQSYRLPWMEWPLFYKILLQADLARENDVAVWFSSMLLLFVSLVCLLCFAAEPRGENKSRLRFGWAVSALIFAGLSLDEMGSLHEKIAIWQSDMGWLVLLVPFVIVVPVYMLLFGLIQIRRSRVGFFFTLFGVVCFSLVPVFEFFEMSSLPEAGQPLWQALEEGTELIGMLAFLAATFCFALFFARMQNPASQPECATIRLEFSRRRFFDITLLLALFGFVGIAATNALIPKSDIYGVDGIPENWFPSALLLCAALLLLHLARYGLAISAILMSIYVGSNLQDFYYPGLIDGLKPVTVAVLLIPVPIVVWFEQGYGRIIATLGALALPAIIVAGPGPLTAPAGLAAAIILIGFAGFVLSQRPPKSILGAAS
jgi:hypothetical protein